MCEDHPVTIVLRVRPLHTPAAAADEHVRVRPGVPVHRPAAPRRRAVGLARIRRRLADGSAVDGEVAPWMWTAKPWRCWPSETGVVQLNHPLGGSSFGRDYAWGSALELDLNEPVPTNFDGTLQGLFHRW